MTIRSWLRRRFLRFFPAVLVLLLILVVLGIRSELPPRQVVIETGPVGGGYYNTALQYAALLQAQGVTAVLRPKADSLAIIQDVQDPASDVDIGFIAQDVDAARFPGVASLGRTEVQPLFVFVNQRLGEPRLRSLLGRSIALPPLRSATSEAALRILALVGVTPDNTPIEFLPLDAVLRKLRSGEVDAGMLVISAGNDLVRTLATDPALRIMSIDRTATIGRLLPFLVPITLPAGIYGLQAEIPPADVSTLGAPVEVVVRNTMRPVLAYMLLTAMTTVHHRATLISGANDFPSANGSALPLLGAAATYYRTGVPWIYRELPAWLSGFVDRYSTPVLVLLVMAQVYLSSKWIYELSYFLLDQVGIVLLIWIHRGAARRNQLTARRAALIGMVERVLLRRTSVQRRERLIQRIHEIAGDRAATKPEP